MRSVELFAGCGGLALGIAQAGFQHALVIERDAQAYATLTRNREAGRPHFADWPLVQADVRAINYGDITDEIDLVSGGPPCQPFSIAGQHGGAADRRDMWPEAIRAVRELKPKAFLFENVRGLLRPAFGEYLEFIRLQLCWPEIQRKPGESWRDQRRRLAAHARSGSPPTYNVVLQGINTADYGVPQQRHRVIVIGMQSQLAPHLTFPAPTHSREALVWSQRVSAEYWRRHDISHGRRASISPVEARLLKQLLEKRRKPQTLPWLTVRDALGNLPRPRVDAEPVPGHRLHPGARAYPGHTGSTWDQPAKTLKAGSHGVPGGENILALRGGTVRYFTIREMARLQGFADDFLIEGSWKWQICQLGNAVPVQIGKFFGQEIRRLLLSAQQSSTRKAA